MRPRVSVPSGAYAAHLLGLDGFRDREWPAVWCGPRNCKAAPNVFRVRDWQDPINTEVGLVAHPALVIRHAGTQLNSLNAQQWVMNRNRVELGLEHLLRLGVLDLNDLRPTRSRTAGDKMIRELLVFRGAEPPTESYAETETVQFARTLAISPWRQLWVYLNGRRTYRVDLVIPWIGGTRRRIERPRKVTPTCGLVLEVNSNEFHNNSDAFQRDHERQLIFDSLGIHWLAITPKLLAERESLLRKALTGAFNRAGVTPYF